MQATTPSAGIGAHPTVACRRHGPRLCSAGTALLALGLCTLDPAPLSAQTNAPAITFKVLLIIKRTSDAYSPLFLPVRARMTDDEVAQARRCFEVETPDMVREVTRGRVRFAPTVRVSDQPLRVFNPERKDSAEFCAAELLNELSTFAKPGDFDSVGYYFLHYDTASGYKIPRAGFGVGWYDAPHALGLFAVNCTPRLNPRDEVFLHEWMHGLEGCYGKREGVALPKGGLHSPKEHGYREHPWRPADTFSGWLEWYRDHLNGEVLEEGRRVGLGDAAWRLGPMRTARPAEAWKSPQPAGAYPAWVYALMRGDLSQARLGAPLLGRAPAAGPIGKDSEGWRLDVWSGRAGSRAFVAPGGAATLVLESPEPNNAALVCALALEPSKNYLLTGEARAEGVTITEKGGVYGVNLSAGSSATTRLLVGTTAWTPLALPFTTGAKAESCRLRLALGGTGSVAKGRASFRNVQVRAIDYPAGAALPAAAR